MPCRQHFRKTWTTTAPKSVPCGDDAIRAFQRVRYSLGGGFGALVHELMGGQKVDYTSCMATYIISIEQ